VSTRSLRDPDGVFGTDNYNTHRPHRSLNQQPPPGRELRVIADDAQPDRVERKEVLGGLINQYVHAA
jgi:putative transposase